jgi:hypothetical protein
LISVTIDPEDDDADLLGKTVSDLQEDIVVNDNGVYGTLKNVTGYTGFSGVASEQSGHYLALKIDTEDDDDEITVELIGGTVGHPVTLDSDRNIVLRITNPLRQKIRVVASHLDSETNNVVTVTKTLRLTDLALEA